MKQKKEVSTFMAVIPFATEESARKWCDDFVFANGYKGAIMPMPDSLITAYGEARAKDDE